MDQLEDLTVVNTWDGYTKGHVDVSVDDDVRSLRCKLSEKLGLPASQGLRLKCGSRDLRDGDRISAIDATVHAMPRGGLAGGGPKRAAEKAPLAEKKRSKYELAPSDDEDPLWGGRGGGAAGSTSSAASDDSSAAVGEDDDEAGGQGGSSGGSSSSASPAASEVASSDESEGEGEAEGQGGSSGSIPSSASPAASEAAEDEGEESALLIGGFSPRPFQKSIIDIVEKPAGDRDIQWVYSLCGKYGKSLLAEDLVKRYDALVIHVDAAKDSLKRIRDHRKKSDTFAQKPVLIIDIPRSKSTHTKPLYTTLETIQGVYGEWTTPPHILVFANTSPDVDKLTPDRWHVYLITSEYELQPAKHLEKGLSEYDEQLAVLQAQEEEAARTGVTPARLLPERGAAGSSGVTSSAPHDDGRHQACGPAATRTCTALCPPNSCIPLEGHRAR